MIACGKVCHASKADALKSLRSVASGIHGQKVHVYRCAECNGTYHIGHNRIEKRQAVREEKN